ncbi:MAG: lipopolysaccharide biosynthesis protein [Cytophagales bacterium]|nr:lipopolysaccharide biosynthesis protein [Cytophagales bacterium]
MGIVIRQSLKNTIVSYAGIFLGAVFNLLVFPKYLTPTQIGIYGFVINIGLMFASLGLMGASNCLDHFYSTFEKKKGEYQSLFSGLLAYGLLGFLAVGSVGLLARTEIINQYDLRSEDLLPYLYLLFPIGFISLFRLLFEAYARVNLRIVLPALLRDVAIRIALGLGIALFALKIISFEQLLWLYIGFMALNTLVLIAYCHTLRPLRISLNFLSFSKKETAEILRYSGYVVIGGLGGLLIVNIDRLMIPKYIDVAALGIYNIMLYMGNVIEVPRKGLSQISIPILSTALKNGDMKQVDLFYKKTSINQLLVGGWLFLGIWCNREFIFYLMPNGELFESGQWVILFIGLAKVCDMLFSLNGEILIYSKYYRQNNLITVIMALLMVGFNVIFIPLYGISGAAFATLLAVAGYNLIRFEFIRRKFRLHPFSWKTLQAVGLYGVLWWLTSLVQGLHPWTAFLLKGSLITAGTIAGCYFLNLSEDFLKLGKQLSNILPSRKQKRE